MSNEIKRTMLPWNMYNNSKEYHGVSKSRRLTENERKWDSCPLIFCTWKARYVGFASFSCNYFILEALSRFKNNSYKRYRNSSKRNCMG